MIYYFSLEISIDYLLSFMLFFCNFFDVHLIFSVWYFGPIILRFVTFLKSYFCGIYLYYFLKITSVFLVFTFLELLPSTCWHFNFYPLFLLIFIYIFCVLSCSCFFLEQLFAFKFLIHSFHYLSRSTYWALYFKCYISDKKYLDPFIFFLQV